MIDRSESEQIVATILDTVRYFGLLIGLAAIVFLLGKAGNRIDKLESRMALIETSNQKGQP